MAAVKSMCFSYKNSRNVVTVLKCCSYKENDMSKFVWHGLVGRNVFFQSRRHLSTSFILQKRLLWEGHSHHSVQSQKVGQANVSLQGFISPCTLNTGLHLMTSYSNSACYRKSYSTERRVEEGLAESILKAKLGETSSLTSVSEETEKQSKLDSTAAEKNSKEDKKKDSWFSGKHAWKLGLLSLVGTSIVLCGNIIFNWGAPMTDKEGNEMPDEFTLLPKWQAYPKRAWREFNIYTKMIIEPSSPKLLPDPLQEPWYQPPYTLVLELTGVLVHPDWTLGTGWRFKKRPWVENFLQQVASPLFEVVIYTHEQGFTAFPIIDRLDPNGYVTFRLFRDATRYTNGAHVKDLDCLNRDLSKVIIVDCDPKCIGKNPRNGVLLKKWAGNDDDRTLVDLAAFLRTIAISNVEDVRTVLDFYNQYDDPIEAFKENQRKVQEQQETQAKLAQDTQDKKGFLGSLSTGLTGRRR